MTYKQIVDKIGSIAANHKMIVDFGYGELSDIKVNSQGGGPEADYPYMFLNQGTHTRTGNIVTMGFNIIMMDQVLDNDYLKIQSECLQYLDDVLAQLKYGFPNELIDPVISTTYTPFKERFQDTLAGMTANVQLVIGLPLDYCYTPTGDVTPPGPTCNVDVSFDGFPYTIIEGESVQYTNYSTVTPEGCDTITAYAWEFEGGTPATSTDENPLVTYNTPGTYYSKLCITYNGGLTESCWTRPNFITVEENPLTLIFQGGWYDPNGIGLDPDRNTLYADPLRVDTIDLDVYNAWRPVNDIGNYYTVKTSNPLTWEITGTAQALTSEATPNPFRLVHFNVGTYNLPDEVIGWPTTPTLNVNDQFTFTLRWNAISVPVGTTLEFVNFIDQIGIPEAALKLNYQIKIWE